MADLTDKQRVFVAEYLRCLNATEAARRAGYSEKTAHSIGWENLRKPEIAAAISAVVAERAMSANEVLDRLADQARGSLSQFLDINDGELVGFDFSEGTPVHLLKKAKVTETQVNEFTTKRTVEIEILDPQAALFQLGKHHGLLNDKIDHGGDLTVHVIYDDDNDES